MSRSLRETAALLAFLATICHALILAWHTQPRITADATSGASIGIHATCLDVAERPASPQPDKAQCPICQAVAAAQWLMPAAEPVAHAVRPLASPAAGHDRADLRTLRLAVTRNKDPPHA